MRRLLNEAGGVGALYVSLCKNGMNYTNHGEHKKNSASRRHRDESENWRYETGT
jgi:hypothetical protein